MPENDNARTIEATPYRRQQARTRGQVPQSHDLSASIVLAVGVLCLGGLGGGLVTFLGNVAQEQLGGQAWVSADIESTTVLWRRMAASIAWALAPIFGILFICAMAANLLQTGLLFLPSRVAPDASRLDPIAGLARVFSRQGAMRVAFGMLKMAVIGAVAWNAVSGKAETFASLGTLALPQVGAFLLDLMFWTSLKLAGALVALGVVDYAWQRWNYEQSLRMTPQDLRDELKDAEGDPQLAAQRKKVRQQWSAKRTLS
jgi:flagellar biosynthetic protein FlhB